MDVSLSTILEATISNDKNQLQNAQRYLEDAAAKNLSLFLLELSKELVDQTKSGIVRMAAGLQLKNYLTSKDESLRFEFRQRWLAAEEHVRVQVKSNILQTLGTEQFRPSSAAQVIAAIGCAELPEGQWPELINSLLGFITVNSHSENLKEASLEALGEDFLLFIILAKLSVHFTNGLDYIYFHIHHHRFRDVHYFRALE
ncbi:Karyopherin (importin) beta 1 [Oopsacas minuta]|uniref:Karyopherin (Importin) beta 1 n=1 Tax=Oopsacas minuta TaxID=111878 RepID=A0AAV7JVB2_9METZ|nr:Karyopherin (importin) beta 1 [Oopsacas minuta]